LFYYLEFWTELFRSLAEQLKAINQQSLLATGICNCSTFVFKLENYKHVITNDQLKLLRADLKSVLVGSLLVRPPHLSHITLVVVVVVTYHISH